MSSCIEYAEHRSEDDTDAVDASRARGIGLYRLPESIAPRRAAAVANRAWPIERRPRTRRKHPGEPRGRSQERTLFNNA